MQSHESRQSLPWLIFDVRQEFMRILFFLFALLCGSASAKAEDDLARLQREVRDHPKSAEAHAALGQAYHWRKDFASAERAYRAAASLDPRYVSAIVPLLDEYRKWDEIIDLAARGQWSTLSSSILGSLATAYHEKGKNVQAKMIVQELEHRSRLSQEEDDYRHYVLAYASLWADDSKSALEHLRAIKNPAMLHYAATSPKFEKLFKDPTFLGLTAKPKK